MRDLESESNDVGTEGGNFGAEVVKQRATASGQVGREMAERLMELGAFLPALMTVEYVAKLLHVVPRVVRRMIALGKIPAMKLGKAWLIPRDAFVRMVEERAMRQLPPIALEDEI